MSAQRPSGKNAGANNAGGKKTTFALGRAKAAAATSAPIAKQEAKQERAGGDYFTVQPAHLPPKLEVTRPVYTKAGVRGFPKVDDAELLLFSTLQKRRVRGPVLDLTAGGGLLAALEGVELRAVEGSAAALSVLRAAGLDAAAAAVGDPLEARWAEPARTVACTLAGDRGNAYTQAQVLWAHACTPVGGKCYLAGDKTKGFDRYFKQAAKLFGAGDTVARSGGMRVGVLTRRPGPTPELPAPTRYHWAGVDVVGLAGVFSSERPDKATALMLEVLEKAELAHWGDFAGQRVLDLGSGAGLIGAWAAQRGAEVTLVDGDLQSVRSSAATLAANGLAGEAVHSDVDAALPDAGFDVVLSNPPFHVGRGVVLDVAREFVAAAERRLVRGGRLVLVANDFLPYEADMQRLGAVEVLAREGGFKVLAVQRS